MEVWQTSRWFPGSLPPAIRVLLLPHPFGCEVTDLYAIGYDKVMGPRITLHNVRLFHVSRLESLPPLSITEFEETSCHKSYNYKEMNSGKTSGNQEQNLPHSQASNKNEVIADSLMQPCKTPIR